MKFILFISGTFSFISPATSSQNIRKKLISEKPASDYLKELPVIDLISIHQRKNRFSDCNYLNSHVLIYNSGNF